MTGLIQSGWNCMAAIAAIPLHPPAASSIAEGVDQLHYFLTAITLFFTVLIFAIIFYFMVKYRRRSEDEVPGETHEHLFLEIAWTMIPSLICVVIFVWASSLYVQNARPPAASTEMFVIGKQWMWHIQHPGRPARNRRAPRSRRRSRQADDDFAGRDPRFLHSRVSREEGRSAGPLLLDLVPGNGNRHLSPLLRPILRHEALDDDRLGLRDDAGRLRRVAHGCRRTTNPWPTRASACLASSAAPLATSPMAAASGPSLAGLYGKAEKLKNGTSRLVDESLIREAIVNPNSVQVAQLPADHAHLQGASGRRAGLAADRLS